MSPEIVLSAMLSLTPYSGDRGDSTEARMDLYRPVAQNIARVARTPSEAAILVALGFHETGFARFVIEGRCSEGPPGQRCDGGKARGVFQLHASACPAAWKFPEGSPESLELEAGCAIRLLRWNAVRGREHTITPAHAAFSGYAARDWGWGGADLRVKTTAGLLAKWGRS